MSDSIFLYDAIQTCKAFKSQASKFTSVLENDPLYLVSFFFSDGASRPDYIV
jgi:hypothetical protein